LKPPTRQMPCKVRELIDTLEPKDQEILKAALLDSAWGNITLANSLSQRGLSISETPIRKHRLGRCSCA